jgi:hypothetical protein
MYIMIKWQLYDDSSHFNRIAYTICQHLQNLPKITSNVKVQADIVSLTFRISNAISGSSSFCIFLLVYVYQIYINFVQNIVLVDKPILQDIALLRLKTPAVMTDYVNIVCLDAYDSFPPGTPCVAAGWGQNTLSKIYIICVMSIQNRNAILSCWPQ